MQEVILSRGERFKDVRLVYNQHGKQTMDEVAKASGVAKTVIHNAEDNKGITADSLAKLALHYGVSADYLLGLSDIRTRDPENREVCEYSHLSEEVIALARSTASVPEALNLLAAEFNGKNILDVPLFKFASAFLQVVMASVSALPAAQGKSDDVKARELELGAALYRFNKACIDLPNSVMQSDEKLSELGRRSKELEYKMILASSLGQKEAHNGEYQKD